jgi:UDP-GlcNAc:undecaprenyl-phosphate/decaprenyl-phosphate GlcNAc-1-phosphate transferase
MEFLFINIAKILLAFMSSFFITFYVVPLLRAAALKLSIVDYPDGKLKTHKIATPYLGGIAVYLGFITALSLVFPLKNQFFLFLLGATHLLFVGLLDDLISMKPYQKFVGQCIALVCFLKGGFFLKEVFLSSVDHTFLSFFWLFISAGWILSVINAFNLVDVMDGLATTLAIGITISFIVIAYFFNIFNLMLLLMSFLGALCAFLWFNKPPAYIYLGDAGSLFIGGIIATIPFLIPWGTYTPYGYIAPLIILFMPLCEVGTLILIRLYKKIPFYQGSPDHFSHYLQRKQWSRSSILIYVLFVQSFLLLNGLLFAYNILSLKNASTIFICIIALWYGILLLKKENLIFVAFFKKFLHKTTYFRKKYPV